MKKSTSSFEKKVPRNPKYDHVRSNIDTGAAAKTDPASNVSSAEIAKRRNEIFKRIKASTLSRLIKESEVCESVFGLVGDDLEDFRGAVDDGVASTANTHARSTTTASAARTSATQDTVVSVVETDLGIKEAKEHLILDMRNPSEYAQYHVPSAISYPASTLLRDQYPPELFRAKRDPTKIVVVVHSTEAAGSGPATMMVQKGFDNLYLLSGGMEELVRNYPEILEGDVPAPALSSSGKKAGGPASSVASTRCGSAASRPTTGSTVATGSSRLGGVLGGARPLGVVR